MMTEMEMMIVITVVIQETIISINRMILPILVTPVEILTVVRDEEKAKALTSID